MAYNKPRYRGRVHRGTASRGFHNIPSYAQENAVSRQLQAMHLADRHLMSASRSFDVRGNCRQRSSSVSACRDVGGTFEFSVASYNILAQDLLEEHSHMYRHCAEQHLRWEYRRQNIMRQLNKHNPDIICLQEVQYGDYNEFFCPRLQQRGYKAAYKQKLGGRTDGCATFYKQKKFNCCNSVPVDFFVDGCSVLDRPNVALLMLLEPLVNNRAGHQTGSSSTCVCVANTHLLYNPGRGDVKLAQLMFLLAAIDEVAGITAEPRPKYHPVILCGDLNLEPLSDLYNFIVSESLNFEGLHIKAMSGQKDDDSGRRLISQYFLLPSVDVTDFCQFFEVTEHRRSASRRRHRWRSYKESFCSGTARHALNLASAYDDTRPQALTSWLGDRSRGARVDYIFYSAEEQNPAKFGYDRLPTRGMAEGLLTLSRVLQLPTEENVRRSGGLPNDKESSDHLMLMAWFTLTT